MAYVIEVQDYTYGWQVRTTERALDDALDIYSRLVTRWHAGQEEILNVRIILVLKESAP